MNLVREIGISGVLDIMSMESEKLANACDIMHGVMTGTNTSTTKKAAIEDLTKQISIVELCIEQLERGGLVSKGDKAFTKLVEAKNLEEMFIYKKEED